MGANSNRLQISFSLSLSDGIVHTRHLPDSVPQSADARASSPPADVGPSPLALSPAHDSGGAELTGRGSGSKRKQPTERGYFIAKELLTTERTYGKDLDVINGVSIEFAV